MEAGGGAEAGENREQSRHREYHGTSLVVPEMPPKSPKKYPKKCLKNAPKKGAEAGENPEQKSRHRGYHGMAIVPKISQKMPQNYPKNASTNAPKKEPRQVRSRSRADFTDIKKCTQKCLKKGAEACEEYTIKRPLEINNGSPQISLLLGVIPTIIKANHSKDRASEI